MSYEKPVLGNETTLALPGGEERPGRTRLWLIVGGLALLAVIVGMWMRAGGQPKTADVQQLANVTVTVPGRSSVERVITATGSLAAKREMPVGVAGEGGMVKSVLVEPGQWVRAGQVLATVDRSVQAETAASLQAQIAVARSDAGIAQSNLDRAQSLVARGFISKADLEQKAATRDAAVARVHVAQAALAEQQARNGRLDIRAPEAGLVLTRAVEAGQIVGASSGILFRMAKGGEMEMRADVAEGDLQRIRVGTPAQVTPIGSAQSYAGSVWQVSPVIDPTSRRGTVRVAVPYNDALRPGGFASATIGAGANTAPLLPNSAIQTDANGNFVYVVGKDDKVERRAIKTGEVSDHGVAIIEGVTGDERIVLSAGAFLSPGQKIKPVPQKR